MNNFPTFSEFYQAVYSRDPFPWQCRLAKEVVANGWPEEIAIETGLGKTSCIDIAVWSMAQEADRPPAERKMPTRIWYVVNRRLLIDVAHDHGTYLAELFKHPEKIGDEKKRNTVDRVGTALKERGGIAGDSLHVTRLRGGAELGSRPSNPSQPALIFATVPMFGSRWLFRGFGTSRLMRPVDAALAGTDSVILLDEAHLSQNLLKLVKPLAECDAGKPSNVLPECRSRSTVVSLTATGNQDKGVFQLDEKDRNNTLIQQRISAKKPTRLVLAQKNKLELKMVEEVVNTLNEIVSPSTVVVFANNPIRARKVFSMLEKEVSKKSGALLADLKLLTGRIREREAIAIRSDLLDGDKGAPAGRDRAKDRERHLIVVATQTLEVGADLDFDILVTEACGARALVQRFGRLNRLGDIDNAQGVVVMEDGQKDFGIYGEEPLAVWDMLRKNLENNIVDLSPSKITEIITLPQDDSSRAGELLPAHLWEWAKTTTPPPGEAPPEIFYDAIDPKDISVSVIWRTYMPENTDGENVQFELNPVPNADEAVDIPIYEVKEAFKQRGRNTVARLKHDRVSIESEVGINKLRPGDIVILPSDAGFYDEYGWNDASENNVFDLSLLRPPGIPLTPESFAQLLKPGDELNEINSIIKYLADDPAVDDDFDTSLISSEIAMATGIPQEEILDWATARASLTNRLCNILGQAEHSDLISDEEWSDLLKRIDCRIITASDEVGRLVVKSPKKQTVNVRSDVFDELSITAKSPLLFDHLKTVGELAEKIARAIGLPEDLVSVVRKAAESHDLGKSDNRFQWWLDPDFTEGKSLMAKSNNPREQWEQLRIKSGWPQGGRHEELSRRLVAALSVPKDMDLDLLEHLVVSHHGYGRPLLLGVEDNFPGDVQVHIDDVDETVSGDLSCTDWEQPARFRRCCERYGYWGLALLEAIVRQADHVASSVVVV